jgi:hypothetical protein
MRPYKYKIATKMKTVEQRLYDYIDKQDQFELVTPNGITISSPDDEELEAEYTLTDTDDASVSISFRSETAAFVKGLGITSVHDIYLLTPDKLIELYKEGLAQMVCFVCTEYKYGMCFQRDGAYTIAENEMGLKHAISLYQKLETPDQFIAYAMNYYTLMECNEN